MIGNYWLETSEFDAELEATRARTVVYMYRNTNILKPVLIQAASLILRQHMTDFLIRSAKLIKGKTFFPTRSII